MKMLKFLTIGTLLAFAGILCAWHDIAAVELNAEQIRGVMDQ